MIKPKFSILPNILVGLVEYSPDTPSVFLLQKLRSGTTGVCALIVGNKLHIAWLGDSQVMLVQQGKAVTLMEPHKPEREVSLTCFFSLECVM